MSLIRYTLHKTSHLAHRDSVKLVLGDDFVKLEDIANKINHDFI